MKNLFTILTLLFLLAGLQLQAQHADEPEKSTETKTLASDSAKTTMMMGCHGQMNKAACCAAKADASAKKSKKKSKGAAVCCAATHGAKCCSQTADGKHVDKPCHPGCTMPCCAKKE